MANKLVAGMNQPKHSFAQMRAAFSYDPETGIFLNLVRAWRGHAAGSRAGGINSEGYRYLSIDGCLYAEHHVAFVMMLDRWPLKQIDHINRDKSDNRWTNLREVTRVQNLRNSDKSFNGYTRLPSGSYRAQIQHEGRTRHLGLYRSAEQAAAAYRSALNSLLKTLGIQA